MPSQGQAEVQPKVKRQLNFTPVKENWNEYKLEDGNILKMKLVVTEVYELEGRDPATGKKNYMIKSSNAVAVETGKEG
jgi:hypothetical protein